MTSLQDRLGLRWPSIQAPMAGVQGSALAAAGVQVGTAYLLCHEATTSALHRAALQSEAARHTVLTHVFTGRPARSIVNHAVRALGPISAWHRPFPRPASR